MEPTILLAANDPPTIDSQGEIMVYHGSVKNGVVVLDAGTILPDGTTVSVRALRKSNRKKLPAERQTLGQRMQKYAGVVKGLPGDMAANHDHYIYGTPRK